MKEEDIAEIASLLKRFEPGFLPYPVFEQIARLVALPIIEFVPLRLKDGKAEVLLLKRDDNDKHWPGLLHTPGTVIRATDLRKEGDDNWPAFRRILEDELKNTKVSSPHYVGSIFHSSKRGAEQAQLFWVEVQAEPSIGVFYRVDDLPPGLIDSQTVFIEEAARNYLKYKTQGH